MNAQLTLPRARLEKSLDGHGWTVRLGSAHWRFSKLEFAIQFRDKLSDEHFSMDILDHAFNHEWGKCRPETCKGNLWQVIQGIE